LLRTPISDNETGILRKKLTIGGQSPRRTYPFKELVLRDELPQFLRVDISAPGQAQPVLVCRAYVPSFFLQADTLSVRHHVRCQDGRLHAVLIRFRLTSRHRDQDDCRLEVPQDHRRVVNDDGTETITLIDTSLGVALTRREPDDVVPQVRSSRLRIWSSFRIETSGRADRYRIH
jgi:hypothetical protein